MRMDAGIIGVVIHEAVEFLFIPMAAAVFCKQGPRHVRIVGQRGRIGRTRGGVFAVAESKDAEVGLVIADAILLGIDNRIASRIRR